MTLLREVLALDSSRLRTAVPARSRRAMMLSDDARQLVIFQLAGEPYSVIGAAFGRPGHRPDHILGCPDPLNRADVAARLEPLRDAMLEWLRSYPVVAGNDHGRLTFTAEAMPQLLVAGSGVVSAVDDLAYDWRYNPALDDEWHELGRELWSLIGLRHWPGQAAVVPLAESLATHFDFGISAPESLKLSVGVALCDAIGRGGLDGAAMAAAERQESGPLGRPEELDTPVWRAMEERTGRVPSVVARQVRAAWERCSAAHARLASIPTAPCAADAAARLVGSWAWAVGPARTGVGHPRRRALPTLDTAAGELERMERQAQAFALALALEDPMVAAERAAVGKGFHGECVVSGTKTGNRIEVVIEAAASQPIVPSVGSLVACAEGGTLVRGRVIAIARHGEDQDITVEVSSAVNGAGMRAAIAMADGPRWFVVAQPSGPKPRGRLPDAPATHPHAKGNPQPAAGADPEDADQQEAD